MWFPVDTAPATGSRLESDASPVSAGSSADALQPGGSGPARERRPPDRSHDDPPAVPRAARRSFVRRLCARPAVPPCLWSAFARPNIPSS